MRLISKFIFSTIFGWKIVGEFPKEPKKYVLIGAPHTSWYDFVIGILARSVTQVKINFIGKDSLFKAPFGFIFRWLGGTPVDRSKSNNLVDAIVQTFNSKDEFRLALSPEGTRKKVEKLKTGFYYIAKGANVPIVMFTLDFANKQIAIAKPFYPSEDKEKDFAIIRNFYKDVKGKFPEKGLN